MHTCEKYEETRGRRIENTWAKDRKNVFFITDNPKCTLKNHIYIGEYKTGVTYHPENVCKMFIIWQRSFADYDFFMMIE